MQRVAQEGVNIILKRIWKQATAAKKKAFYTYSVWKLPITIKNRHLLWWTGTKSELNQLI
jgi:hypothetical protein